MERIVVQASPARVVGLGLACLGFTAAGVWMLLSGDWLGWLPIAFFGGVGAWGLTRMWRQRIHLIATADGLAIGTGGFVPWRDVAAIGVGRSSGARVLGVRLARYDNYLQSLTPQQLRLIRRVAGFGSGAGAMLVPLQPGSDAANLLELDGRSVAGVLRVDAPPLRLRPGLGQRRDHRLRRTAGRSTPEPPFPLRRGDGNGRQITVRHSFGRRLVCGRSAASLGRTATPVPSRTTGDPCPRHRSPRSRVCSRNRGPATRGWASR